MRPLELNRTIEIAPGVQVRLIHSGHILGSAMIEIHTGDRTVLFTGDLGRPHDPVMKSPVLIRRADYLVVESTYGNRRHDARDPLQVLAEVVNRTAARHGVVVVPAFAVGRVQTLLWAIHQLKSSNRIPDLPVYLNSPMAVDATNLYHRHRPEHRLTEEECRSMCTAARFVNTIEESKALNARTGPMIILSASGMGTGGRVLHHLKAFAPDPRNTILFSGFQSGGTRGAAIVGGAESVKIHGEHIPVRAEVAMLQNFPEHADSEETLDWLGGFVRPPRRTFVTHGEPAASDGLRRLIEERLKWSCHVPDYLEHAALD